MRCDCPGSGMRAYKSMNRKRRMYLWCFRERERERKSKEDGRPLFCQTVLLWLLSKVALMRPGLALFNFRGRCVSELLRTWLVSLSLFLVGDYVSNLISSCAQLPRRYALIRAPRITMMIIWLHLSPHIHFPTISESTLCFLRFGILLFRLGSVCWKRLKPGRWYFFTHMFSVHKPLSISCCFTSVRTFLPL